MLTRPRKLLIALVTTVATTGVLAFALPAGAEQRVFLVYLATGGAPRTVVLDVPPGTVVDASYRFPGVTGPVTRVDDVTAALAAAEPDPATTTGTRQTGTTSTGTTQTQTQTGTTSTQTTPTTPTTPTTTGRESGTALPSDPGAPAGEGGGLQGRKTGRDDPREKLEGAGAGALERELDKAARERGKGKVRGRGGVPTPDDPSFTLADPGAVPIGVPNFFIDRFRIPPFLLPIYQAAGIEYGIPWQVLAAINEIETDYGRNLNVSSAGAVGWMQFLPSTWRRYGVDANGDDRKDPYNPVDAIFAAARYLKAAGAEKKLDRAIFAYNNADWYVQSVLLRARLIGGLPDGLVGSLTGLTQGRFPVAARAKYADDIDARAATRRVTQGNAALPIEAQRRRRYVDVFADRGAPVIAVQDGRIARIGRSKALGRFVVLEDVYGNRYTYGQLGKVAKYHAVPKPRDVSPAQVGRELELPKGDPKPAAPATAGVQKARRAPKRAHRRAAGPRVRVGSKERLFALPARPQAYRSGGRRQMRRTPRFTTFQDYFSVPVGLKRRDVRLRRLKVGSQVIAGTILGRIGDSTPKLAPHLRFEIRPAGRGAPQVDPKPILDGWKLLEATAIYRAAGKNPFFGPDARNPTIGQILLMSKEALQRRVLADPQVDLYTCGRRDVAAGVIDRRVLATVEYLAASGLRPTVSSLRCGHSYLTKSGNVSEHSSGNAVDIPAINGTPILGHQGRGSIADLTIRRLLLLQGTMKPHQIISLMTYRGVDNTMSLPDHDDHVHVGFEPRFAPNDKLGRRIRGILKPGQWVKLIDRLNEIPNPTVSPRPSRFAVPAGRGRRTGTD